MEINMTQEERYNIYFKNKIKFKVKDDTNRYTYTFSDIFWERMKIKIIWMDSSNSGCYHEVHIHTIKHNLNRGAWILL